MHSYTYNSKRSKRNRRLLSFILIFLCLFTIMFIVDSKTRPVIKRSIATAANMEATKIINKAVEDELTNQSICYDDIVSIERDSGNNVTSIETNITVINLLKTRLNLKIAESIEALKKKDLYISLGTLSGNEFFSSRGPKLNFSIEVHGYAQTSFISSFEAVGINQTRHRIYIEITADITASLPGYNSSTKVTTSIIAAETVIVGKVPTYYSDYNRLLDKSVVTP